MIIIEGSPEDVIAVAKGLDSSAEVTPATALAAPTSSAPTEGADPEALVFVATDVARKVLSRRSLSREQKIVLSTLAKGHPGWVSAAELQAATGYSPAQFAGLMGAFGRRFTHTEGYVQGTDL